MNKLSEILIAMLLLVISSTWGNCIYNSSWMAPIRDKPNPQWCKSDPDYDASLPACLTWPACSGVVIRGYGSESSYYYYDCRMNYNAQNGCYKPGTSITLSETDIRCRYKCTTEAEADSIKCGVDGNIWQDGTCKINHCTSADSTWLSTSTAACTGSNNYALVNTDSACEHVGTCCPNDSIPSGNTCKWCCDSVLTACNNRTGDLFGGVLPDTSVSGQDTTFSYQCYYNCSHSPNPDSTVYLVEGNIVLSGPSDSIPDGIKSQSTFNSVRTTTGGVYVYDYLSPAASEYIDSIAAMKCVEHLWRCVINSKYVYWYDNQEVPAGCTNIVRVK